jgi:hypothetical protein
MLALNTGTQERYNGKGVFEILLNGALLPVIYFTYQRRSQKNESSRGLSMSERDKVFDGGSIVSASTSGLVPTSSSLDAESMLFALAELNEEERREILLSISPQAVALLVEILASACTARVSAQSSLAPDIQQWARDRHLL